MFTLVHHEPNVLGTPYHIEFIAHWRSTTPPICARSRCSIGHVQFRRSGSRQSRRQATTSLYLNLNQSILYTHAGAYKCATPAKIQII